MSESPFTLVFGSLASLLFISSHLPMLARAARTKDLHSYSPAHLLLSNLGNLLYWVYVSTLPFGPIWVMHAFYTVTAALMLTWYVQHATPRRTRARKGDI